jgi:hypothetical protein
MAAKLPIILTSLVASVKIKPTNQSQFVTGQPFNLFRCEAEHEVFGEFLENAASQRLKGDTSPPNGNCRHT